MFILNKYNYVGFKTLLVISPTDFGVDRLVKERLTVTNLNRYTVKLRAQLSALFLFFDRWKQQKLKKYISNSLFFVRGNLN